MKCCYCKGDMTNSTATYFTELENTIVIIKNVPCFRCSQCGEVIYPAPVLERVENIIDPDRNSRCKLFRRITKSRTPESAR